MRNIKISALVGWSVGSVLIVFSVAGLIISLPPDIAVAALPSMTDCTACHLSKEPIPGITRPQLLTGHDKLGLGNDACMVCHDQNNKHLGMLTLYNGTQIPLKDSSQLCGQCHEKRYKAWLEGTHGVPNWSEGVAGLSASQNNTDWPVGQYNGGQNTTEGILAAILKVEPGFLGGAKKTCTDCHDPHSPQIVLTSVTKPHPISAPPPPSSPPGLNLGVFGAALIIAIGGSTAIVLTRKVGKL